MYNFLLIYHAIYKGVIRERTVFMNQQKIVYLLILTLSIFIIAGCTPEQPKYESSQISNISNSKNKNLQNANEAKQFLSDYDEVSRIHAVNHNKDLLIAIDINHEDRFQLDNLEKNLRNKLKERFKNLNITLSTDQKLLIEVEQLEHKLENEMISDKELTKKIKKLQKLTKEKT